VFEAVFTPSVLDEDAAHGLGGRGKEVAAVVPAAFVRGPDESEVRLVDEGSWLEGMAGRLGCHPSGRELAQLVIDEREQIGRGAAIPGRSRIE
jgi:hypothetical protein